MYSIIWDTIVLFATMQWSPLCYSVDVPLSPNDLERFDFKFSEFENSKFE